jgi:hypothetical protein
VLSDAESPRFVAIEEKISNAPPRQSVGGLEVVYYFLETIPSTDGTSAPTMHEYDCSGWFRAAREDSIATIVERNVFVTVYHGTGS